MRSMQLVLFITAFVLAGAFMVPAHAQTVIAPANQTENVTYVPISGTVAFDPNNYNGVKSVTDLTIYARSPAGIDTRTNPVANGSFAMSVPGNGTYSIWVFPSKFDYLNATTNETYSVIYPDGTSFKFTQNVTDAGLSGIVIPAQTIVTGPPMSVTPEPPTLPPMPTPKPSPGFTMMLAALAAAGVIAVAAYHKR